MTQHWCCPVCGRELDDRKVAGTCLPPCDNDFEARPAVALPDPTTGPESTAEPTKSDAPLPARCHHCERPVDSASCQACQRDPRGTRVRFPWGDVWVVPGPTIEVGRQTSTVFQAELAGRTKVGREHLRIEWADHRRLNVVGDGVIVIPYDSKNGTFLDGELLEPYARVFAPVGSRLQLSPDTQKGLEIRIGHV